MSSRGAVFWLTFRPSWAVILRSHDTLSERTGTGASRWNGAAERSLSGETAGQNASIKRSFSSRPAVRERDLPGTKFYGGGETRGSGSGVTQGWIENLLLSDGIYSIIRCRAALDDVINIRIKQRDTALHDLKYLPLGGGRDFQHFLQASS